MHQTVKMSDDEARDLHKGDILARDGAYVRVAAIKRVSARYVYDAPSDTSRTLPAHWLITVAPSSEAAFSRRPARIAIEEHETRFGFAPCRQLPSGEWMEITKIVRRAFTGAAGTGYVYTGVGKIVSAAQATEKNDAYQSAAAAKDAAAAQRINSDWVA